MDNLLISHAVAETGGLAFHRHQAVADMTRYLDLRLHEFPFPIGRLGIDLVWNPWLADEELRAFLESILRGSQHHLAIADGVAGEDHEGMRRRRWHDLTPGQRAGVVALGSVQLSLAASAWADLATRPRKKVNGPKWAWALVIGVNFVGPVAYFVKGRRH